MVMLATILLLFPVAMGDQAWNFTVLSAPVRLRYGQVHNKMQQPMRLPEDVVARYASTDKVMAVTGFDVEMVRLESDGSESLVKLNDHYLHHYALSLGSESAMGKMTLLAAEDESFSRMLNGCHAMKGMAVHAFNSLQKDDPDVVTFGSASGAEYRHNPQRFAAPFRRLLSRPEVWMPLLHIINTNAPETTLGNDAPTVPYSPLLECPCTPQRKINVSAGTIDGKSPDPPIHCSSEFAATGNPSCHLATYIGGWRCCEHDVFLVDTDKECSKPDCSEKPLDEVYMKFTFYYEDAKNDARQVEPAACCDLTASRDWQGNENIEYDVPQCAPGTPVQECVHVAESVQPLAYFGAHHDMPMGTYSGSDLVDLVFAAPHLHLAGMSLELIDALTNKTLCSVRVEIGSDRHGGVIYGTGSTPGNEKGYLVGLDTCTWGGAEAPRFRRDHPMRSRAIYNATRGHTGVMSLWLMDVSAVTIPELLV